MLAASIGVAALALAAGCGGDVEQPAAVPQVLRISYLEDPDFDPASPEELEDNEFQRALFETLTTLDDRLDPVPALAERWEVSADGLTFTFHLRGDGRWTNGEPLTARDFEWSWKRVLAPETDSARAATLAGIAGASAYSSCERACGALRGAVGVHARDERTLVVRLAAPRPWFPAEVANPVFAAVHRPTVERYRGRWTHPRHIVTSGPFRLVSAERGRRAVLEKWRGWRGARDVSLDRVVVLVQPDKDDRIRAFARGAADIVFLAPPPHRFENTRFFERYPLLAVGFLEVNAATIRDPRQRRAMALAADLRVASGDLPATTLAPQRPEDRGRSFLGEEPRMATARASMGEVASPRRNVSVWSVKSSTGQRALDLNRVARAWRSLGIETELRGLDPERFYATLDDPMPPTMDVRAGGWVADYPDPMAFFEPFTCTSRWNKRHFCDPRFDALVARAVAEPDRSKRSVVYQQLEALPHGSGGPLPGDPDSTRERSLPRERSSPRLVRLSRSVDRNRSRRRRRRAANSLRELRPRRGRGRAPPRPRPSTPRTRPSPP